MQNFKRISHDVDVTPFVDELNYAIDNNLIHTLFTQEKDAHSSRREEEFNSVFNTKYFYHHEDSIWEDLISDYSFTLTNPQTRLASIMHSSFLTPRNAYNSFPVLISFLKAFAEKRHASLQRVVIARLFPFGQVKPHADSGLYWKMRDRYHLVLEAKEGSIFISGGERQKFVEGEIWWFNNHVEHEVVNDSPHQRTHIIFDLLPNTQFSLMHKIKFSLYQAFFSLYFSVHGEKKFNAYIDGNPRTRAILVSYPFDVTRGIQ